MLTEMAPEEFWTDTGKALAAALREAYAASRSLETGALMAAVQDEALAAHLTSLLLQEEEPLTPLQIEQEIEHLKARAKGRRLSALKSRIESGAADTAVMREYIRLQSELKGTPDSR